MKINMVLDTESNLVEINFLEKNRKKSKVISANDLIETIKITNRSNRKDIPVVGELYCKNNNISLIQSIRINENSFIYILKQEKNRYPFSVYQKFYGFCGMPQTLFAITIVNKSFVEMSVTVCKDDVITPDSQLYQYPFTNVYGNCRVCTGANVIKGVFDTPLSTFRVIDYFYSMPNTTENYRISNNSKYLELSQLATSLVDKDFDDNLLVPSTKFQNYNDWIKSLII